MSTLDVTLLCVVWQYSLPENIQKEALSKEGFSCQAHAGQTILKETPRSVLEPICGDPSK